MRMHDDALRRLRERVDRREKVARLLECMEEQEQACREEAERLRADRDREQADVDRLERLTLASLAARLTGSREEKLDREMAEAYAAALRCRAAERQLAEVLEEREALAWELAELADCGEAYRRALEEKRSALEREAPDQVRLLLGLEEAQSELEGRCRELEEALAAGGAVLDQLGRIQEKLDSAESWAGWDLLGGGLISGLAKHEALDEAQALADELQSGLRRYEAELADVSLGTQLQVRIDGFLRVADFLFDGLFADWAVLDRIQGSQAQVEQTRCQVAALQETLEDQLRAAQAELEDTRRRWSEAVLQA